MMAEKRWESPRHPSESAPHRDRSGTSNGYMEPHQIPILFESHSFSLRLQNEAHARPLTVDQYSSQGQGSESQGTSGAILIIDGDMLYMGTSNLGPYRQKNSGESPTNHNEYPRPCPTDLQTFPCSQQNV